MKLKSAQKSLLTQVTVKIDALRWGRDDSRWKSDLRASIWTAGRNCHQMGQERRAWILSPADLLSSLLPQMRERDLLWVSLWHLSDWGYCASIGWRIDTKLAPVISFEIIFFREIWIQLPGFAVSVTLRVNTLCSSSFFNYFIFSFFGITFSCKKEL